MPKTTTTLFEEIGGHEAVETVVDEFYNRVLADESLRGFFGNVDMNRQRRHQTNFITMALGGPNGYAGRSIKQAHQRLPITNDHFDRVARHLSESLAWAGVGPEEIRRVLAIVDPLRSDVVAGRSL